MHYHAFVFGFTAIWFIFVVIGCIGILFQKNDSMPFIFRFILYFLLFGALIVIKYKVKANIVKNKLIELLQ